MANKASPCHLRNMLVQSSQLKGSLTYKKALEDYIKEKNNIFRQKLQDISLYEGRFIITREEQLAKIKNDGGPYNQLIENLKSYIKFKVDQFLNISDNPVGQSANRQGKTLSKGYIQRVKETFEYEMFYSKEINQLAPNDRARRRKKLEKEQKRILTQIKKETASFFNSYFADWAHLSVWKSYEEFLQEDWIHKLLPISEVTTALLMAQYTKGILETRKIEKEDLAPLGYLQYLIDGFKEKVMFRHIVIDEAQDLSPFEFKLLDMLSQNKSFTILGDLSQGICYYKGLSNWEYLQEEIFLGVSYKYFQLQYRYRSTKEIVQLSNRVIPEGLPKGLPIERSGEKPSIERLASGQAMLQRTIELIRFYQNKGYQSIGIVAKRDIECQRIAQIINKDCPECKCNLILQDSATYEGGVSIVPITLAKGLEFDAVIVMNASDKNFKHNVFDAKLLYVALSRPLHNVHVLYIDTLTPLLAN